MNESQERSANHLAYRQMKDNLVQAYGVDQFVAISNGQVIAEASSFLQLRDQLIAAGRDPSQVLLVQVGADYPETAVIFSQVGLS